MKVEFLTTNRDLPLQVRSRRRHHHRRRPRSRINGCHRKQDSSPPTCAASAGSAIENVPQVVIRTPRAVDGEGQRRGVRTVGRSASLDLHNSGCSAWTVADVAGDATSQDFGARLGEDGHGRPPRPATVGRGRDPRHAHPRRAWRLRSRASAAWASTRPGRPAWRRQGLRRRQDPGGGRPCRRGARLGLGDGLGGVRRRSRQPRRFDLGPRAISVVNKSTARCASPSPAAAT